MENLSGYQQRLTELAAKVDGAQLSRDVVLERAAGYLAGRVGGSIDEVHAHLRSLAREQSRDVAEIALEVLSALQGRRPPGDRTVGAAVNEALRRPNQRPGWNHWSRTPERAPMAGDWTRVVQQVLDAVAGRHLALEAIRDPGGEITDYRVVAVSPAVTDLSGRSGSILVGQTVRQLYPTIVDSPVWHAWAAVLSDGVSREVGPFPYVGDGDDAAVHLEITNRASPVGDGLLNTWVRHDEEVRLAERIAQTERLGNLGWVEWDLVTDATIWSDEMYRIYERDPRRGPLRRSEAEAMTVPEDRPIRREAAEAFGRGETVDTVVRVRVGERIKHLRTVLDADRDPQGRPLKVYGIVQDITASELNRAKLAEVERQLRARQRDLAAEHRLAAQLQQIVLPIPPEPFDLPGLRVAVRYLPAEQASRVGGDFFHAAATRDGQVLLGVGDVAGHGVEAATTMAQLRHALTALSVTTTTEPACLLTHLNTLLFEAGISAPTATAIIARYDPAAGDLTWAQAGHPAPLLSRAGSTTELARPAGALLGAMPTPQYRTATTSLVPGDLLVFYTDGLIERRGSTLAQGLAPVVATLDRITAEPRQQPLSDLLAQLTQASPEDDTCVLAVRRRVPAPGPAEAREP